MTNTLIHGIIDALSGSVGAACCRTDPWSKGIDCDSTLHYRKYHSGSIYFASDYTGI